MIQHLKTITTGHSYGLFLLIVSEFEGSVRYIGLASLKPTHRIHTVLTVAELG